jgi:FlgD Ig-like domain
MNPKRLQAPFILACCLQVILVCQLNAGYKLKWSSPSGRTAAGLYEVGSDGGMYANERDFDMDGNGIPAIILYDYVVDSSGGTQSGKFKVSAYDSRNGTLKWQQTFGSDQWDREFIGPPLLGFYDIDADGAKEAVVACGDSNRIVDWKTNTTKWSKPWSGNPVVFDMDGDGYPEIGFQVQDNLYGYRHYEIWGSDKPIGTTQPVLAKQKSSNSLFNVFQSQMYAGTRIEYQVQKQGMVSLRIFSADGALVKDLVSGVRASGDYDVQWNGTANSGEKVASGTYYYQLGVDAFRSARKAILLR